MTYKIFTTKTFKKDFKKLSKSDKEKLYIVLNKVTKGLPLEEKYKDHKLIGNFLNCRECHIKPDMILIYKIEQKSQILSLIRIGSHSELFK